MALNTTSGDPAADSYAATADADTYFSDRGITAWTGEDTVKENALRRATNYLDNQYGSRWIGIRTNDTQSLAWPRGEGYRELYRVSLLYPLLDIDGFPIATDAIPAKLKTACMEAALLILTGSTLELVLTRGGAVKSQSDTVGPITSATVYMDSASAIDRYTVIEGLLRGLVRSTPGATSGIVELVRA